jgi:hypothetical protein
MRMAVGLDLEAKSLVEVCEPTILARAAHSDFKMYYKLFPEVNKENNMNSMRMTSLAIFLSQNSATL